MRCIVKDCKNHEHEGQFIGSLCYPCHTYISKGQGEYSQAFRNAQRTWVDLTDEEAIECSTFESRLHCVDAVNKKLKDKNTLVTCVQDPVADSFVVVAIPNWDIAKEFIKVRSQS